MARETASEISINYVNRFGKEDVLEVENPAATGATWVRRSDSMRIGAGDRAWAQRQINKGKC